MKEFHPKIYRLQIRTIFLSPVIFRFFVDWILCGKLMRIVSPPYNWDVNWSAANSEMSPKTIPYSCARCLYVEKFRRPSFFMAHANKFFFSTCVKLKWYSCKIECVSCECAVKPMKNLNFASHRIYFIWLSFFHNSSISHSRTVANSGWCSNRELNFHLQSFSSYIFALL